MSSGGDSGDRSGRKASIRCASRSEPGPALGRGCRIARSLALAFTLGLAFAGSLVAPPASAEERASDTAAGSTAPSQPPGTLEFVGENLFATANGRFHQWRIAENGIEVDDLEESFVVVEVTLASVDTGNHRRDDHLRSDDFFEVGTYPLARVRVHSLRREGEDAMGKQLYLASFDVDLHGVQKTLEGEVELLGLDPLVARGRVTIDRVEFGIGSPPNRWNPMSVKGEIPVSFRVEIPQ
jgi:polyisoprenoid-binding protein YceI